MPTDSKTSHRVLAARELERKAFALRLGGASFNRIADALGVKKQTAHAAVVRVLQESMRLRDGDVEAVRALEIERLDSLLVGVWRQAVGGDGAAIDRVLRIMQRRAAYLGLDEPAKSEISTVFSKSEDLTDEQLLAIASGGIQDDRVSSEVEQPVHAQQVDGSSPLPATDEKEP